MPDDSVIVGSDDGLVYALNSETGAVRWTFTTSGKVRSSPAVEYDGAAGTWVVYVAAWNGAAGNMYAIEATDLAASQRWVCSLNGNVNSSPAIDSDAVYVPDLAGYLYAIDKTSGVSNWSKLLAGHIYSSPAIDANGTIHVGADDGKLYAIDPSPANNGKVLASFDTGGSVRSSPAIASDGTVYVGSASKAFFAVTYDGAAEAYSQKWVLSTDDAVQSSPAIGFDGEVYCASFGGQVFAIDGTAGPAGSIWPMFHKNAQHTGRIDPP